MSTHAERAGQLPLRSRPLVQIDGAALVVAASLLTPLALLEPPGRDAPAQRLLAGLLLFIGDATMLWWWSRAWSTLSYVDEQLIYSVFWGERRFGVDAVTGAQVTRWPRYGQPVSDRTVYLYYREGTSDRWVVLGAYQLGGATLMLRAYQLAKVLDVAVDDIEQARMRASAVPMLRELRARWYRHGSFVPSPAQ